MEALNDTIKQLHLIDTTGQEKEKKRKEKKRKKEGRKEGRKEGKGKKREGRKGGREEGERKGERKKKSECTFFSSMHRTFSRIDHIQGHNTTQQF